MLNKANVRLRFKANEQYTTLPSSKFATWTDGLIQVMKGNLAQELIAAFPDNFEIVDEKAAPAPTAAKAQPEPERNKGVGADLFDEALAAGVIEQAGPWYKFGDKRLGKGKSKGRAYLAKNPDVAAAIGKKLD